MVDSVVSGLVGDVGFAGGILVAIWDVVCR